MGTIWGSCTGTSGSKYNIWLDWTAGSPDIVNNTTPVNVKVYLQRNDGYSASAYSSTCHRWTQFDSANQSDAYGAFDTRNNVVVLLKETNYTIGHNPDGTRSVYLSGGFDGTGLSSLTGGSVGSTVSLPTIPRASSCTATNALIEASTSILINRFSDAFTHTLKYSFGSLSGTIATGVATSYGWTVPSTFYAQIPNAKSGTCTITCETYSGGTLIGSSSTTFTASVNEATNAPTVSASIADTNAVTKALTDTDYKVVKFFSNMGFTITATAKNSATISSRSITCGALNSTSSSGTLTAVESNVFVVTATDSRGITTTTTYNASSSPAYPLVDYVKLTVSPTLSRTSPTGSTIAITYSGNYFNDTFGTVANTLTVKYRYRESGTTTWSSYTTITPTKSGNTYTGTQNLSQAFDYTKAYEFEVTSYDQIYTSGVTVTVNVSQGIPVFDWNKTAFNVNVPTTVPTISASSVSASGDASVGGTLTVTGTITQGGNSLQKAVLTETCYLPVDFNAFRVTADTTASAGLTIPLTKLAGGLTIASGIITLLKGYAYEFLVDFTLTPAGATGGAVLDLVNSSTNATQLWRANNKVSSYAVDASDSSIGAGFLDLTASGTDLTVKAYVRALGSTPTLSSSYGGLYIKRMKKITV